VGESGFQAEEKFKTDLVALLSALRSIMVKSVLSDQDSTPYCFEKELDTVRNFQVSTSGLALTGWAARQSKTGLQKDVDAATKRWRTLVMDLSTLSGVTDDDAKQGGSAFNDKIRHLAATVEFTIGDLTEETVRAIARDIRDLPGKFPISNDTRGTLLTALTDQFLHDEESRNLTVERQRLAYLRNSGIDDPDIDLFLAVFDENADDVIAAIDRGANTSVTLGDVLSRYEGYAHDASTNPALGED
jgi:hypothetical protein